MTWRNTKVCGMGRAESLADKALLRSLARCLAALLGREGAADPTLHEVEATTDDESDCHGGVTVACFLPHAYVSIDTYPHIQTFEIHIRHDAPVDYDEVEWLLEVHFRAVRISVDRGMERSGAFPTQESLFRKVG